MNSYTAANEFPYKLFRDCQLLESIYNKNLIMPRHVQLSPTNICNLNCSFCSCDERDRNKEWSLEDTEKIPRILSSLGTLGVTITGGGEPLLFPHKKELLQGLTDQYIKVGLVTNGTLELRSDLMKHVTWCRFSFSDERKDIKPFLYKVSNWLNSDVDLAFSYVLTKDINFENLLQLIHFVNEHNFTHMRIVSDILDSSISEKYFNIIKDNFKVMNINDSKVIYQPRNNFTKGDAKCLISLLKPMIYSDGYVYPCCGAQYALKEETRRMPEKMRMGHYTDLPKIFEEQKYFNGSVCDVCYYSQYNTALNQLLEPLNHLEFI